MNADLERAAPRDACLQPRIPSATYRLQFHGGFTFADAREVVPYLEALGISDLYASSVLAARPGSPHGYDIVDHNALNPEIGTAEDYERLVAALRQRGMGQLLDVVPNHMGIAAAANRWWNDVLENGPASPFAEFFDIDWDPVKRQLANKVLLPILGDQYGRVLEDRELILDYADGAFRLRYHDTRLPIAPRSGTQILSHRLEALAATLGDEDPRFQEYQSIITALTNLPGRTETAPDRVRERMREKEVIRRRLARLVEACEPIRTSIEESVRVFNGKRGDPRSFDLLDRLLDDQAYRLAHWRVAAEEINYRRFFDVNDLAAIRMENPAVFRETHRLILRLLEEGQVSGLRIDHPDGLFDPPRYFLALQRERFAQVARDRLRRESAMAEADRETALARAIEEFLAAGRADPTRPPCRPLYLLAEKILGKGERLPTHWAIHGTTGYDFLNLVGGLFVDGRNEKAMTAACAAFTGQRTPFADLAYQSKQLIMRVAMSSELNVLGHALSRLAERNRHSRDFTLNSLAQTLVKVTAPGVPDFYQGTELWDFSLVDPDNRRPVDFARRGVLLAGLRDRIAAGDLASLAHEMVEHWADGRIKLYVIHRALACRRGAPDLFRAGDYVPLPSAGPHAAHLCAFARRSEARTAITVVPRLAARLTEKGARLPLGERAWGETRVVLPPALPRGPYRNHFTGATIDGAAPDGAAVLPAGEVLAGFPVALLEAPPPPPIGPGSE